MIISNVTQAYESDQHTVPNIELADVGVDMSIFIHSQIQNAVVKINTDLKELPGEITQLEKEIIKTPSPKQLKKLKEELNEKKARLESIQSKVGITLSVYKELGGRFTWEDQRDGVFGLPLSMIPYPKNVKEGKRITYVPSKFKNIYAYAGFHRIISSSYFVFCSSIKMFGTYLGVDKLGHMFNQGFEYFKKYHIELAENPDAAASMKSVIDWGKSTENGMYGAIVDGVYSNGDLAANLSGFYFYENLMNSITIDGKVYPPLLIINTDKSIEFNPEHTSTDKDLLALFISNHLNEALNPSHYELLQRKVVKVTVKNRCERVLRFYDIGNSEEAKNITDGLSSWHGMDYGHKNEDLLRIDELCF